MPILLTLWVASYRVYGARKLWKAARCAGPEIGRDQVARLMREVGIRGVRRGRPVFTTRSDPAASDAPTGPTRPARSTAGRPFSTR
jgi:putative transposase